MKLLLAACGTFALLWLAHSSARAGLAIIAFGVLAALGILMIAPIFRTGPGSDIDWPVVAVIVVCIGIHLVQSLRNLERGRDGDGATQATVQVTSADHRAWLTQQQAWLLKVGTFAGVLLLIAGFGHDIVWFLFSGDASGWRKLTGRIGAGGTVLATIVSAAYTVIKAAPTAKATAPSPPGAIGRLLIAVAPPLVLLVLALLFAFGAHDLLAHMIKGDVDGSGSDNLRRLGSAAVWLAVVEVLFALFEIHEGPATPLPDSVYWWRRFVPYPVLRMLGKLPAGPDTEKRPWFYLFSPQAWVRIAVVAVMVIVIG
ncbi:MAG TPA: hypothetical protein VIK97_11975, partial [Casimicrobiaceae bacterium]